MVNIMIVANSLSIGGGAEKIAAIVGSELFKRGHNTIFLERYSRGKRHDYYGEIFTLYNKQSSPKMFRSIREINTPIMISKICREKDIDAIISFSNPPNYCSVLSKMLFRNKAKIIISERNNPLRGNFRKYTHSLLYPQAYEIVVQTKRISKILEQDFSITNTKIIPNPIQLERINLLSKKQVPDEHKKIMSNGFTFMNIGTLTKQKAQWNLLRAFKKVNDAIENTKLVILGDGDYREKLSELSNKLNLVDNIFFFGKVDNVFPYLSKADVFVLTSLYEGFPNVVIEALSQNIPIISTDCVSGPREILCLKLSYDERVDYPYHGDYGILTQQFDGDMFFKSLKEKPLTDSEEMLADTMVKMYENEKLRKKYSNGLERAKDFDVDKIVDQWEEIL